MTEPTKKFITIAEAAKITGRTYETLRRAVIRGELRASQFTPRGTIYVKPGDLDKYFEDHVVNPLAGRIV